MTRKLGFSAAFTATTSTSASSSSSAPVSGSDSPSLPKLIVFDLDYTLWPYWVDTHVTPPLKHSSAHDSVKDAFGETFSFYSDVPSILSSLRAQGIKIGAASRTHQPDIARQMLRLLHIEDREGKKKKAVEYFDHMEIYPGNKITHFEKLHKATGFKYEDMLFFDDEARNRNVEALGVTMHLVKHGMSTAELENGLEAWRKRHDHDSGRMDGSGG